MTTIAVTGTTSIGIGDTTQLTATATLSDGTTQVVTGQATWASSNTRVATVSASGLVRTLAEGSAQISATYQGRSGQSSVRVAADVYAVEVNTLAFLSRGSCDGILDPEGEFSLQVNVKASRRDDTVLTQTPGYPSADGIVRLREFASRVAARTAAFDMTSREGDAVSVEFRATEWDKRVVVIPPSIEDVRDSEMNDRSDTDVHTYTNRAWSGPGGRRIRLGSGGCTVDLEYEISATRR